MPLADWMHKYPKIAAMLQQETDTLDYAADTGLPPCEEPRPAPWYYRLAGREAVPESDAGVWYGWMAMANRRVATTVVIEGMEVSTVFLGFDYDAADGPPLLFETMVFCTSGAPAPAREMFDCLRERWPTWEAAQEGHDRLCAEIHAWLATLSLEQPDER